MRESGTRVLSRPGMTAPLTPALALAYLHELSTDVRAVVVLDAAGSVLAGAEELAPRARALLANAAEPVESIAAPAPGVRLAHAPDGALLVAQGSDGATIAVLAGPYAVLSLLGHDLAATARAIVAAPARDV